MLSLWAIAVAVSTLALTHYSNKPGKAANAPEAWPKASNLILATDRPTLLVLLHPQCSCSRATVAELERILSEAGDKVDAQVLFFESSSLDSTWVEGDLWDKVQQLPHVTVTRDTEGTLIRQFGGFTSGQTLLYNSKGQLLFKGGITAARGHEGDNKGKQALLSILSEQESETRESFVFGCSILGEAP